MAVLFHEAWLGYYNGLQRKCGWSPTELVATANQFSACALLPSPIRSEVVLLLSVPIQLYNCRAVLIAGEYCG